MGKEHARSGQVEKQEDEKFVFDSLKDIPNMPLDSAAIIIRRLGQMKSDRSVRSLLHLVHLLLEKGHLDYDENSWCKIICIVDAFKGIGDPRVVESLLSILQIRPHEEMRLFQKDRECIQRVIRCLGDLGDVEAIDPLLDILESPSTKELFREDALDALSAINNRKALERLYRLPRVYCTNCEIVERLWRTIFEIEEYSEQVCYWCGKAIKIKAIDMENRPEKRKICKSCWKDLEPLQRNPNTRTVIQCDWDDLEKRK